MPGTRSRYSVEKRSASAPDPPGVIPPITIRNVEEFMLDQLKADPDNPITGIYPLTTKTPANQYGLDGFGKARLIRTIKPKGVYWLSDVSQFQFLKVLEPVPVTHLQTKEADDWETWMVDDPEHWVMLHAYARRIRGPRVCIAGLGLGLIQHILAKRPDIREVTIIERNTDVIQLMGHNLAPAHQTINIHHGDFWERIPLIEGGTYDTFFVDLWRGPVVNLINGVLERREYLERYHPWPLTESLYFWFQSIVDTKRRFENSGV
jgi:hypothetical protein